MKIPSLDKEFPSQHRDHGFAVAIQWFFYWECTWTLPAEMNFAEAIGAPLFSGNGWENTSLIWPVRSLGLNLAILNSMVKVPQWEGLKRPENSIPWDSEKDQPNQVLLVILWVLNRNGTNPMKDFHTPWGCHSKSIQHAVWLHPKH